jgi:hypothetical protein
MRAALAVAGRLIESTTTKPASTMTNMSRIVDGSNPSAMAHVSPTVVESAEYACRFNKGDDGSFDSVEDCLHPGMRIRHDEHRRRKAFRTMGFMGKCTTRRLETQ